MLFLNVIYCIKMESIKHYSIFLILLVSTTVSSQSITEVIDQTEKATFETRAYNSADLQTGMACGFFLSGDGLAITMGYIFEKADSAVITLRNGRTYQVKRIISIHPQSNLALIKVEQTRQKSFNYLLPSKQSFKQNEDLLYFTNQLESEDGMTISPVNDLISFPIIKRTGLINGSYFVNSAGAPAINRKGELCGVINVSTNGMHKILYNTYLLNDSNWVNINVPINEVSSNQNKRELLSPYISQSLLNICREQYIEAAKGLSKHLKTHLKDDYAYNLRAYARHYYQNIVGRREDIKRSIELKPNGYLAYYFQSIFDLEEKKPKEAKINLELSLTYKEDFAPAITQLAILNFSSNGDVRLAYDWFTRAIESDSLESKAYYERSRLRLRHSDDQEATLSDINKTIYLDPDKPGIYSIRGTIYFSNKDFLPAINDFDVAIQKDINDVHAWFNRGIAHYNIGLHQKACYDWDKAGKLGNYDAFKYISRYCKNVKRNVYNR